MHLSDYCGNFLTTVGRLAASRWSRLACGIGLSALLLATGALAQPSFGGSRVQLAAAVTPAAAASTTSLTFGVIPPQLPAPAQSGPILAAVEALAQGRAFLVHLYTNWADYPASLPGLDTEVAAYAAHGMQVDLALRYVPPAGHNGDVVGFAAFVSAMVAHYADQPAVTALQVTNEANSPLNAAASDGAYQHAERALVDGIEAGATERAHVGSRVTLGFNWFYSFGPVLDRAWWTHLGAIGGPQFAQDVDWVGIDAYPGTYYPPALPTLDPTAPGKAPGGEMATILTTVRSQLMPLAGLGPFVQLGMSEIGWATAPPLRSEAEQAQLVSSFTTGVCAVAQKDNVRFLQWYDLADSAGSTGGSSLNFGLLNVDLSPKLAFRVYQAVIRQGCPRQASTSPSSTVPATPSTVSLATTPASMLATGAPTSPATTEPVLSSANSRATSGASGGSSRQSTLAGTGINVPGTIAAAAALIAVGLAMTIRFRRPGRPRRLTARSPRPSRPQHQLARGGGLELSPSPSLPITANHEQAGHGQFPATGSPASGVSVPIDPNAFVTSL